MEGSEKLSEHTTLLRGAKTPDLINNRYNLRSLRQHVNFIRLSSLFFFILNTLFYWVAIEPNLDGITRQKITLSLLTLISLD